MPKDAKVYTLFIAAPGDLDPEKQIIKKLVQEWNLVHGRPNNVRIETTDWSEAFPDIGDRPQAIINQQVFDGSDLVVALFWNRFGTPTGVAGSGTEEEILRAIAQGKPLMLYFSDKGISPSRHDDEGQKQIRAFKERYKDSSLYNIFSTDEEFTENFRRHLALRMGTILQAAVKKIASPSPTRETDQTDEEKNRYKPIEEIKKKLQVNFPIYITRLYGIIEAKSSLPNGIKISKANNNKAEIKKLKEIIADWDTRISEYTSRLQEDFADITLYSDDEFKNEIVAKKLWTVKGALTNMDAELRRYRSAFRDIEAYKVKDTVQKTLDAIKEYNNDLPPAVGSNSCKKPEDFKFGMFTKENTLLTNVIGKGIRSEILHKLDPRHFSLMTRRSIWGLFFLSDEADEFVVDEQYEGLQRTVHNWDYLYDHFNYYNYVLYDLMKTYFTKYNIKLKEEYKYGYTNLFLVDIFNEHSGKIDELKRYKTMG